MKLRIIYEMIMGKGLREDLRPRKSVEEALKNNARIYKKARGDEKDFFDKETLKNPYADTRILNGTGAEDIKNVLVGIDIDVSEILLADRLREKGMDIDLVLSHHPSGRALAQLDKVMDIQPAIWEKYGFTEDIARGVMKGRKDDVALSVSAANHYRASDAAKLLGIPLMCAHTAADNCVAGFLQKAFDKKKPKKLADVIDMLNGIPEYRHAAKGGSAPFILLGKKEDMAGRIFVDMTGGTSGPDGMFARLSQSGIGTVVGMHCKESAYKTAKSEFIKYVIAGHIASDNLGMNLLLDAVEEKCGLNIIECSGFRRVRRRSRGR